MTDKIVNHTRLKYMQKPQGTPQLKDSGIYIFLVIGSIIFLIPIVWLVLGSLKLDSELRAYPVQIFPERAVWENYFQAGYDHSLHDLCTPFFFVGVSAYDINCLF